MSATDGERLIELRGRTAPLTLRTDITDKAPADSEDTRCPVKTRGNTSINGTGDANLAVGGCGVLVEAETLPIRWIADSMTEARPF
jgi:hypothetical protein